MAKPNPSTEPSMEEILASIRRIISDDGAPTPASKPVAVAPAPEPEAEEAEHVTEDDLDRLFAKADGHAEAEPDEAGDVLELTEAEMEPEVGLVEGLMPDESEIAFVDPAGPAAAEADALALAAEPEPEPEPEPVAPPPPPPRSARPEPLPQAHVRREEPEEPLVSPQTGATVNAAFGQLTHTILSANARTLDDLVKEMLRPMLKSWLDENLPVIVERLVRAEIERVSRGR